MLIYICFLSSIFVLLFMDCFKILPSLKIFRVNNTDVNNSTLITEYNNSNTKNRKLSLSYKLAILILFCFTAFRFNVGWDYIAYYNTIEYHAITNIISNGEYLNILLIEISRKINLTNLYFFVNAFICIFLIVKTIKSYSKYPWLSLVFFIGFPLFYLNSLSVIRLFSALAISFYGFKYIEKKNFIRYLITVLIATMFHKSAIISLSFYFLKDIKLKAYKLVLILGLLPITSTLINNFVIRFFPRYSGYTQFTTGQEGTKAILIFIVIGIVSLLLRDKIIKKDYVANIYYNLFYVGLCIYLMFFNQGTMGHRLSLYGTIYSLLLLPHIVFLFKNKREQLFFKIIIYIFCIVAFLFTIYVGAETYLPYKTIWSKY